MHEFVLPKGWQWKKLGEVCLTISGGGTPSREVSEYFDGDIIWLTPTEINKEKILEIDDSREKITETGLKNSSAKILPRGTVLMTSRASIGFVAIAKDNLTTNQGFANFLCHNDTYNYYLAYWLFSQKNLFNELASGTTFKEISKSTLKEALIPLPPLPTQQKIVAKIEAAFARLDEAIERQKLNIQRTENLKKAVLEEVFAEGTWEEVKFSDVINLRHGYQFRDYDFTNDGIPVVKIGQCKDGFGLDLAKCSFIDIKRGKEFEDVKIQEGDILMALTGGTLGKVTVVDKDYGLVVQNYRVGNFIPDEKKCLKGLVVYILKSSIFQNLVKDKINAGAQPNIGKENIDNLKIPLPSLPVQRQIVAHLDRVFAHADDLLAAQRGRLARLEALKKSILEEAFRGELVS